MDFLFIVTVSNRALFVFPERLIVVGYLYNMLNAPRRTLKGASQFCSLAAAPRCRMMYKWTEPTLDHHQHLLLEILNPLLEYPHQWLQVLRLRYYRDGLGSWSGRYLLHLPLFHRRRRQ